jgi:curved DNA-binding protein CbpA
MRGDRQASNYYEVLGVRPDASNMDIISAYRQAKLAYRSDSIATYSLFDDAELNRIRDEIEQAYLTLSNPERRQVYDAELAAGHPGQAPQRRPDTLQGRTAEPSPAQSPAPEPASAPERDVGLAAQSQVPAGIRYRMATATVFSGELLREIREFKGVELAAISEHTKISRRYLQAIEDEDTGRLPEATYLKGYLKQYAAMIGLDPELVVSHYPPLRKQAPEND